MSSGYWLYEVSYRKTYLMEEEEDLESGMIEKESYGIESGTERFETIKEVKEYIKGFVEYQMIDEDRSKYSDIRYKYIDKNLISRISGICVNNRKSSDFMKGAGSIYARTEEETVWIDIARVKIDPIEGNDLISVLKEMDIEVKEE